MRGKNLFICLFHRLLLKQFITIYPLTLTIIKNQCLLNKFNNCIKEKLFLFVQKGTSKLSPFHKFAIFLSLFAQKTSLRDVPQQTLKSPWHLSLNLISACCLHWYRFLSNFSMELSYISALRHIQSLLKDFQRLTSLNKRAI